MTGQVAKNRGRFADRGEEPETKGPIGDPPEAFLSQYGDNPKLLALWNRIVAEAPIGVLTFSDREYLAKICVAGVEAGRSGRNQLRWTVEYTKMLKGIGMTPEGRAIRGLGAKVAKAEKAENPLDAFTKARNKAS